MADEIVVVDLAGSGEDHAVGAVVGCEKPAQVAGLEALDAGGGAENRPADGLVGKGHLLQELVGDLVRAVAGGSNLLQDHLALALQLLLGVTGALQDIGEDVEREADVAGQHARVVGRGLQTGRGIELATDGLDLLGNIACGAPLSALEGHVLQKMRDALLGGRLVARADTHPHAHRHRLQVRHAVGDDAQAVGQASLLDRHAAAPLLARLRASASSATKRSTAARSLGSTVVLSGSVMRVASRGGSTGRSPAIASMASGNLAGLAVARTTWGVAAIIFGLSAAITPHAVCGSSR